MLQNPGQLQQLYTHLTYCWCPLDGEGNSLKELFLYDYTAELGRTDQQDVSTLQLSELGQVNTTPRFQLR